MCLLWQWIRHGLSASLSGIRPACQRLVGGLLQSHAICHAVYLQAVSAQAGGARRLRSAPDSVDARPRTSPHSSVYFLNRPLFGLTSVGREYLRKRGRKSVENKGKGKKLCDRDCPSLFLITAELQSAWRHQNRPSRQLGRPDGRGRLVVTLANTRQGTVRELFQCLCILDGCFWFCKAGEER